MSSADPTISGTASLYRLMSWLSPSYPVGAFAYSHGLEWAVEAGEVSSEDSLRDWMTAIMTHGGGWTDAVLFSQVYGPKPAMVLNDLALAISPSEERYLETTAQGSAFIRATQDAWPWPEMEAEITALGVEVAYPIAVGLAARGHGLDVSMALHAYLHGFASNLISAGVRLVPLGQSAGQRVLSALEPVIAQTVARTLAAELDDLGGCSIRSDIFAMKHETQYTRLFRS